MVRIQALAKKQLQNLPQLNDASIFGADVSAGYRDGPTLFLEDHKGIELTPPERVASHEYRILGLARSNDYYLISKPRIKSFERYLDEVVGLKSPNMIEVSRGDSRLPKALAAACLEDESALSRLVAAASAAGTLNICPYLSGGHDWLLGAEIARRSGCPVQICGPLPQLSQRVNDKLWFTNQVSTILSKSSVPPTYAVYGPIAVTAVLSKLAKQYERLVIKLPASAGSMGNLVLESEFIRSLTMTELRRELMERLHAIGWHDSYPILIGVWETAALASPSAQIWIPQLDRGLPMIEGVFGQTLSGERQSFAGATQIELPNEMKARFYREALEISYYFQCLGYVGRMSLDALLTGENLENAQLHWIECNGRWGGVSIPMMVARRLEDKRSPAKLLIVQRAFPDREIADFEKLLAQAEPWLYSKRKQEGIVFLEPTDSMQQNITFFAIAKSQEATQQMGSKALQAIVANASALIT